MGTVAAFSRGLTVQLGWLGLGVSAAAVQRLACVYKMNRVNSRNRLP